MTWWGTREHPSPRMVAEILAMKKAFPLSERNLVHTYVRWDFDFEIETVDRDLITSGGATPYWLIRFRMRETSSSSRIRSRDVFEIKVKYPSLYPAKEPIVTLESHDAAGAPHHFFDSDVLCLHSHDGTRTGWDPAKSTAATFGLWAVEWIRAWLYWKRNLSWPETG